MEKKVKSYNCNIWVILFSIIICLSSVSCSFLGNLPIFKYSELRHGNINVYAACGDKNKKTACMLVAQDLDYSSGSNKNFTKFYSLSSFNNFLKPLESFNKEDIKKLKSLDNYEELGFFSGLKFKPKGIREDIQERDYSLFVGSTPTKNDLNLLVRIDKNLCELENNATACKLVALRYLTNSDYNSDNTDLNCLDRIEKYITYSEKACNWGDFYSCNEIGRQYRKGVFVTKDYFKAYELLRKGFISQTDFVNKKGLGNASFFYLQNYCFFNREFSDLSSSKVSHVDEWLSNVYTSIYSLSLDKNTPESIKKESRKLNKQYEEIDYCKQFPLPKHSYYYSDEFVPIQQKQVDQKIKQLERQEREHDRRQELYYQEQYKKFENMPDTLEINGRKCQKNGLGYDCD